MKHFKILIWFHAPQVKWYMKPSTKNIVYKLPHELPNSLRLNIIEHFEIMEKRQKWVEAEPSTPFLFQKKYFGTSDQKLHKKKCQSFSFCPALLDFLILLH